MDTVYEARMNWGYDGRQSIGMFTDFQTALSACDRADAVLRAANEDGEAYVVEHKLNKPEHEWYTGIYGFVIGLDGTVGKSHTYVAAKCDSLADEFKWPLPGRLLNGALKADAPDNWWQREGDWRLKGVFIEGLGLTPEQAESNAREILKNYK